MGGLLAVAVLASLLSAPKVTFVPDSGDAGEGNVTRVGETAEPIVPADPTSGLPRPTSPLLPGWLNTLLGIVCVTAVVVLVGWLLWMLIRDHVGVRPAAPVEEEESPEQTQARRAAVRAALDEGLVDLDDTDADPRRAVIACWVRLEEAASAAGTPREIGDTPTDLVLRLLRGHQVSPATLDALAQVYREARYAQHAVDESMRELARGALRQLRAELSTGVVRPAEPTGGAG